MENETNFLDERFWDKVNKDGPVMYDELGKCWEWTFRLSVKGYGQIHYKGRTRMCHRVSYEDKYGEIPKGIFCLHKCDNRKCVNPNHLFLGTHKDNMIDMKNKNRQSKEVRHYRYKLIESKLDEDKIRQIKEKYKSGSITQRALAKEYNISQSIIFKVLNNIHFKFKE